MGSPYVCCTKPGWLGWVEKWVLGGERGAHLFSRLLGELLFPSMSGEIRELRERDYEASGRLGLVGPPEVLEVSRRMTRLLLKWQENPGPAGLEAYGPVRRELTRVARKVLGSAAIEQG